MVRFSSQTTVILLAELALFEFLPPTFLSYQYLTAVSQISIKNCFTKLAALKALKSVSLVLKEFSQIHVANIEPKGRSALWPNLFVL